MSTRKRQLAESAWMLGTASLLYFLGTHTPVSVFALLCVPVPFAVFGMKRSLREMTVMGLVLSMIGFLLNGPSGGLLAFLAAMLGSVMGVLYERRRSALAGITGGAGIVFLSYVLFLAVMTFVLHINIPAVFDHMKQELINEAGVLPIPAIMTEQEWKEQVEWQFRLMEAIIPTFLVLSSFATSGLVHGLNRLVGKILRRPIPKLIPMREWSFPPSLLYYYFGSLLILLLSGDVWEQSFWGKALLNVNVMLNIILGVQGLSFCLFAIHLKRWRILAPALVVSLFIFPVLTYILSLLGIFDLGIGLRKKLETRVKRG
ncbi:DUF2232 domain-containing protein [Brevibacillus sp. SYP-B805]|uniref:DUF2232 domain-containing protein n=1 Tax=Brevibacillus sp. SYP-B805 TaxID=1578199 RepID=UPI0013ED2E95|nr:DUF2232 domain-containing protein [Brevibacillus sp. SYP-B805]NGQ96097.1 DUF2232 domain-containing protein [Brevibacillus sp. SYP-B805]